MRRQTSPGDLDRHLGWGATVVAVLNGDMARRRPFRLQTERLTLRLLARSDITAFTRYRNVPDIARYQEWPLPYTRDLAHELVDEMESLEQPRPGGLGAARDGA